MTLDLQQHLIRQMVFSKATFGPGPRTHGVLEHITKEVVEVRDSIGKVKHVEEWCDLVILSLDGLTRAIWAGTGYTISVEEAAAHAVRSIVGKQSKNELRDWPDWRGMSPNKAIEHVRGNPEKAHLE